MEYDFKPILLRIKESKELAGLTNQQLAERSGIAGGTLNKILSGETTNPQLPAMMSLAKALGVSIDYLLYGLSSHLKAFPLEAQKIAVLYVAASPDDKLAIQHILKKYDSPEVGNKQESKAI